jgi:four helix bundle protein
MATYERFEDLPVWQEAILLAEEVEDFLDAAGKRLSWSKRDQIERASLSVSNNIAEGFERGSTAELLQFIYIARGSAGEVRSMLCFFARRPVLRDFRSQISNLKSRAESCSRQLRAWADHLQNSEIKGQRHLNDSTRDQFAKQKTKAAAFQQWDSLVRQQIQKLALDHPMRVQWEQKHGPAGEEGDGSI